MFLNLVVYYLYVSYCECMLSKAICVFMYVEGLAVPLY